MPAPATSWPPPPQGLDPDRLVWAETVRGCSYTHLVVSRGTTIRLTDLDGSACAHLLAFNADLPSERLSVADTVRIQRQPYLTAGCVLLSDRGRALATIVQDTSGRHDPLFGTTTAWRGSASASDDVGPDALPPGGLLLSLAAAKHDLARRDIAASIAFFQGVCVDDDGAPRFLGSAGAGASVAIRAELPLVVLIANAHHPLDPGPTPECGRLEILAWRDNPTAPSDPQWTASLAGRRAYINTAAFVASQRVR